jgi:hypothetical protein
VSSIFNTVVENLIENDLMVLLNNYVSDASAGDDCCSFEDENGLWYNSNYDSTSFQTSWQSYATKYRTEPMVIGFDLRHQPRDAYGITPTWGGGQELSDWKEAA